MKIINIHQAKTQLSKLIGYALEGEEIIIAKAGEPLVQLTPVKTRLKKRKGGQWRDQVWVAEDFDVLPEELLRLFKGEDRASTD